MDDTAPRNPPSLGREELAERLLTLASKHMHDPLVEIDWDAPVDPERLALPEHRVCLYGTPLWERMDQRQRARFASYQWCSTLAAGTWAELILIQGLVRGVYDEGSQSSHAQFALTEVADECRHSIMFARHMRKLGYTDSGVRALPRHLGRVLPFLGSTALFASTLFVEEFVDTMQREMLHDETIEPLARQVARIHVIEEARHISFAREELERRCARMSRAARRLLGRSLAISAVLYTRELVHPRVYTLTGLPARSARSATRTNPAWHRARVHWSHKAIAVFQELDLIHPDSARIWRRARLVP
ncbi:diiron oxygenase [Streptomyces sp. NPDC127068]|uniref:AurF N-oxygenase family protein n=1 Tax=Streptomyces sp. NPDC127068 TaxID=3347127 RepID=UPI003660B41C